MSQTPQQPPVRRSRMDRLREQEAMQQRGPTEPQLPPSPPLQSSEPEWLVKARQNAAQQASAQPVRSRVQRTQEARNTQAVYESVSEPEVRHFKLRMPPPPVWAIAAAVIAALVLMIVTSGYDGRRAEVLSERAAHEQSIREGHPLHYQPLIEEKARKYNLSPAFVAAIMLNESSFRPDATSSVGARGLMQLMDATASWIHGKMDLTTPYDFQNLYDPTTNTEFGCWYLRFLSDRFRGDPILVAAAFHAGQGEVQNWLNDSKYSDDGITISLSRLPDGPTKQYVTRVLNAYAAYKRLYYGG